MAIKDDREYRNLGSLEAFNPEDNEEKNYIVRGYASTFEPYLMFEADGVSYYEKISPTAFDSADMSDVIFLRDHTGTVLARTKNGAVKLTTDNHGLLIEANLGLTEAAKEMYEDIKVGNYQQMSFSFIVGAEHFEEGNNAVTRCIDSIKKCFDISAVAFPQNPTTEIGVSYRALFDGEIKRREAERQKAMRNRELLKLKLKLNRGK